MHRNALVGGPSAGPESRRYSSTRLGSYPALDGMRAIAVIAVMLYHFGLGGLRGGFLGVDVFFVLSGYLITGQLATRWVIGGQVSLGQFWAARARRLLPGLGVMLTVTAAAVVVLDRVQLSVFRGDLAAAATYSSNWWYVFHERSYFVAAGRPPVLLHLWSLAVEEQFYLVWPVVVAGVVLTVARPWQRLRILIIAATVLGLGSSFLMGVGSFVTSVPELGDPSRWYFGTDSHVMGLMAGAVLALVRRGDGLGAPRDQRVRLRPSGPRTTVFGFAALTLLLVVLSRADEYSTLLYRIGFPAVSLLTVAVVAVATRPGPLALFLNRPILRGIGRRSYLLYLWHWPVACFTRPGIDLPVSEWVALLLRVGLTLALTEVTYRCVEQPVRRLGWRGAWSSMSHIRLGRLRVPAVGAAFGGLVAIGLVLPATAPATGTELAGDGTVYVSNPGHPGSVHVAKPTGDSPAHPHENPPPLKPGAPPDRPPAGHHETVHHQTTVHHHTGTGTGTDTSPPPPGPMTIAGLRSYDLAVYGDSVVLGAIPELAARFHSVTNFASIGEQSWNLLPELAADAQAGRLDGDVVLIHTGDNGVISGSELRACLTALSDAAAVVLVQPYVPRSWQGANLATVRSMTGDFPNLVLMDWDSIARAHPGYMYGDDIHLNQAGEQVYAKQVSHALVTG